MSELQDAIDWVPAMEQDIRDNALDDYLGQSGVDMLNVIVAAAKRVADLDEDAVTFAILQAVTLDDKAVRENPMMLHDAAKAVIALLLDPLETDGVLKHHHDCDKVGCFDPPEETCKHGATNGHFYDDPNEQEQRPWCIGPAIDPPEETE